MPSDINSLGGGFERGAPRIGRVDVGQAEPRAVGDPVAGGDLGDRRNLHDENVNAGRARPGRPQGRAPIVSRLWPRRRSQDGQHQQAAAAGVAHAVSDAFGRDQQIAGGHRQLAAIEQEQALAFEHVVDLVLAGVRVQCVLLAGLEGVQPDQQPRRLEDGRLAHLVGGIHGVVAGTNHSGMCHGLVCRHVETPVVERERRRSSRADSSVTRSMKRLLEARIGQALEMRMVDDRRHELAIVGFGRQRRRRLFEAGDDVGEAGAVQAVLP